VRRLAALCAGLAALALPAAAAAHPLGNFTVNRFTAVELSGKRIYVHYVLDLAEIPTLRDGARVRRPGFSGEVARRLVVTVDGRRARLEPLARRVRSRPGAAGLKTLRFEAVYELDRTGTSLTVSDRIFPARLGWREIVARAERGATIERATVPRQSASRELRSYPRDLLSSPLDVRAARLSFRLGSAEGSPPAFAASAAVHRASGFEALVARDLTPGFVLLSLVLAVFWGAAHALSPGHGKAIVAGYLVGSRGTARHAVILGAIVTVTHTAGVFALGLVTLALSAFIVPEQLYPWLTLVSGLLVVAVGVGVVRARVREALHARAHALARDHDHHGHAPHHHHDHHHHPSPDAGLRGLVGLGVSGGIVPCPTALVVLLAAISLHRVGYGLVLIVAFSLGLAASVTAIGLLAVTARRAFSRLRFDGAAIRALPAVSALVVLALGVAMTARALPQLV
jgi:ABC-type nickel/cobalt efflux system permease component RcnA